MFCLAFIIAVTFISVDCKQRALSLPLSQTCSPPAPCCNPPIPVCNPPIPVCNPPIPVCNPPVPICSPPVPICSPPVPVFSPPITVAVCETPQPCAAIPFVTDLHTCPDFYFTDILLSPIGSLDPIFSIYGCPEPAPCSSSCPKKALSSTCSLPPGFTEDYSCDCYLRRGCIPPPFI